jgi:uncharacterized protein involved in outer membrane biogenesis
MSRSKKRWLSGIAVFLLLVAAGVYFFDWNLLRGPIARRVEHATGRSFAINGDLHVRLSMTPRITMDGLVLGNAAWAKEPTMAQIARLEFTVELLPLLGGRVVLPELSLSEARVSLEKNAQGVPNWEFDTTSKDPNKPLPSIGALTLDRAHIDYRDPTIKTDVAADISTIPAGEKNEGRLEVSAKGRVKGLQSSVDGTVGSVLALNSGDKPYPITLRAALGSTRASVDGTLLDPLHLKGESLRFDLEGSDLAQLFPLIGVPLPPTPPYKLSGHLDHSGDVWTFRKFAGRVGNSDLAGDFGVDRGQTPQLITADLNSRKLDMKDLGGLVGADRGEAKASPKPPPADKALPQEPFSLEKLRVANADVKFRGERVITEKLPLEKIVVTLKLRDAVLSLEPLNFTVAGGNLVSQIRMDAREQVIKTNLDMAVKQVRLEKLFPAFKLAQANAGVITGRTKLATTGNSVAAMLSKADGDMALMMEGGSVSELLVRLLNLDVANALPVLLTGDRQLPVRCMVTHLAGKNGDFKVQTLVLDTGKAVVTGKGGIDFAKEAIDLSLVSKSKSFSLAAFRGPINIKGTFKNPKVAPDYAQALGRGAAAVALGVVTGGVGALLPLIDLGGAKDSDCTKLIGEATPPAQQRQATSAKR